MDFVKQEPDSASAETSPENMDSDTLLEGLLLAMRSVPRPRPPPPLPTLADGELRDLSRHLLSRPDVTTPEALEIITLLLTGDWSAPDLPALRELAGDAAKTGVCGTVWKNDELAYKCKTCERDPTCAVCVPCFRHGDHVGHDYAMIRTGGGCCDCGDVQAWKPNGFCSRHRGASGENDDPAEPMSPRLRVALVEVAEAISSEVLLYCERFYNILREERALDEAPRESGCSKESIKHVGFCLTWLEKVLKCGDGIRRVIGVYLAKPLDSSWLSHMLRLDGVDRLPPAVCEALHSLYFQLITDLVFKRAFLELFVANYSRFVHALVVRRRKVGRSQDDLEARKHDIMEQFSVQLFTVPALIPVMMRDGGLLDVLMNMILHLLETASMPVLPYVEVNIGESQFELSRLKDKQAGAMDEDSRLGSEKKFPFGVLALPEWVFRTGEESGRSGRTSGDTPVSGIEHHGTSSREENLLPAPHATIFAPRRGGRRLLPFPSGSRGGGSEPMVEPGVSLPEVATRYTFLRSRRTQGSGNLGAIFTRIPQVLRGSGQALRGYARSAAGNSGSASADTVGGMGHAANPVQPTPSVPTLEELREIFVDGQSVSLREAEALNCDHPDDVVLGDAFLNRSFLPNIKEMQAAAVEADTKDRERQSEKSKELLKQREVLQQIMFEDGIENLVPAKRGVCPLYSQDFGKWYRSAIADARQRSLLAATNSGNIAHTMRVEWFQSLIMEAAVWRVVYDLRYVLTHSEISIHFIHHRPDLFRMFVRMISMMQGVFPGGRHFGNHVRVESETWAKAFTLEIEFFLLVQYLVVAYCRDPNPHTRADASPGADTNENVHLSPAESRARLLRIARQALDEWLEREKGLEKMSTIAGEEFSVAHNVSVHLPLHRLVAMLGHHCVRLDGVSPSFALSGSNAAPTPEELMNLLRHPLRIQAFLSQVRAGMWRRNGRVVIGQTTLYRSIVCAEWYVDMDIFLFQTCVVVGGVQRFVSSTLSAFEIHSFSDFIRLGDSLKALSSGRMPVGNTSSVSTIPVARSDIDSVLNSVFDKLDANTQHALRIEWMRTSLGNDAFFGTDRATLTLAEYAPSIVEDLFTFLVHVATERARCGYDDRQYLRRKLVHQLVCGDYTHSLLLRASPRRTQQPQPDEDTDASPLGTDKVDAVISAMVDEILQEIADFERPHGMEQGRYRLKDSIWSEFDRFAPQVSVRYRGTAEDRYLTACKRMNCRPLPFQTMPVANLPLYPSYKPLRGLAIWLCSQGAESLVKVLLERCLPNEGGPQSLDGALLGALYFACMAVEFVSPSNPQSQGVTSQPDLFNTWLSNQLQGSTGSGVTCLDYIAEMYCLSTEPRDQDAPFQEVQHGLERILIQAHARGDGQLRQRLSLKVPSLFSMTNPAGGLVQDGDKEALAMSQRQRRIREMKKRMQEAAMAQMRASQDKFEKLIADNDSEDPDAFPTLDQAEEATTLHASIDSSQDVSATPVVEGPARAQEQGDHADEKSRHEAEKQTCALCREEASEDGGYMGLVGFLQTTSVPMISRRPRDKLRHYPGANEDFMTDVQNRVAVTVGDLEAATNADDGPAHWRNFFQRGENNVHRVFDLLGDNAEDQLDDDVDGTGLNPGPHGQPGDASAIADFIANSWDEQVRMDVDEDSNYSSALRMKQEELKTRYLDWNRMKKGCDQVEGVHVGFCGHSIHSQCFQRYFRRLEQSQHANERYEGEHVVALDNGEFLCPFCRRLANFLLPVSKDGVFPAWQSLEEASATEKKDGFDVWMKKMDASGRKVEDKEEHGHGEMETVPVEGSDSSRALPVTNAPQERDLSSEIVAEWLPERQVSPLRAPQNVARLGIHELKVLKRLSTWHMWKPEHTNALRDGQRNVAGQEVEVSSINVLMLSVITTVICAEIGSRSAAWAGSDTESERRLLGMLVREARAQAGIFYHLKKHHLKLVWDVANHKKGDNKAMCAMDAFSCFVFLLLLWDGDLMMEDVHGSLRLCYQLAIRQAVYRLKEQGNSVNLLADVDCEVLLFLRRVAILSSCFLNADISVVQYAKDKKGRKEDVDRETSDLLSKLHLPSVEEAVTDLQEILCEAPAMFSTALVSYDVKTFAPERFGLLSLPPLFQTLLEQLEGRICDICHGPPQKPVLCLACGDIFCYGRAALVTHPCEGKEQHAKECGSGVGVFLVLKQTCVVVMRHKRKSQWGSPFLDEHGEEDNELHRGKPLHLSLERYQALEHLWLSHRFDHDFRILNHHFMEPTTIIMP